LIVEVTDDRGKVFRTSPVVVKRTIDAAIDLFLKGYATERLA